MGVQLGTRAAGGCVPDWTCHAGDPKCDQTHSLAYTLLYTTPQYKTAQIQNHTITNVAHDTDNMSKALPLA